jgi:hypothetical protein
MRFLKLSTLLFLLWIAPATVAQTNSAPTEQTAYYLGEVKMNSASGQSYGSSISLAKRTLKPAENKIVELVLSLDSKQPAREYNTVFNVTGSKFTVKDEEGTFAGEGEFLGKAWEWEGWKYSVNMFGERKGTLKAEDTFSGGRIKVKKSFYSPDGQLRIIFSEDLQQISKEMYEILHTKLLQK